MRGGGHLVCLWMHSSTAEDICTSLISNSIHSRLLLATRVGEKVKRLAGRFNVHLDRFGRECARRLDRAHGFLHARTWRRGLWPHVHILGGDCTAKRHVRQCMLERVVFDSLPAAGREGKTVVVVIAGRRPALHGRVEPWVSDRLSPRCHLDSC